MKRLLLYTCLLSTCLFGSPALWAQQKSIKVASVCLQVHGAHLSPQEEQSLLRRMKTRSGSVFSQVEFDSDLKYLAGEFEHIDPELSFQGSAVTITLVLYPKHHIRHIRWCGNQHVTEECLQEELGIEPGSCFDPCAFATALQKVHQFYAKKSYFEAHLDYEVTHCGEDVDIVVHVKEGPAGKIKHILFCGVDKCEEEAMRTRIITDEYSMLTSWFTNKGIFIPEMAEYDRCMVLDYLQNEGFADAKVRIEIQQIPDCDRINVIFDCHKGERFYFGNVTFAGNCLFEDAIIEKQIGCLEGHPFSVDKLRSITTRLQALYGCKGYIEACTDYFPRLRQNCNIYDVVFKIKEGQPYRVGFVKVFGNTYTKSTVILNESLLIPGEKFDHRRLKGTSTRLQNVGYFDCVNVYPVKTHRTDCDGVKYRDVNIEVKEASTGNVAVSGGFSTTDSLYGSLEITERNFNYAGIFSALSKGPNALRGNGEFMQMRGSVGTKTRSVSLRWTKPYFNDTKWVVGFDLSNSANRAVSDLYDLKQTGIKVFATHPLNAFVRYGWTYRYTNSEVDITGQIQEIEPGDTIKTIADKTRANAQLLEIEASLDRHGVVSAIGPTITYDSTDCPRRPTNGFRSQLLMEYAGIGGDFNFLALHYLNSYYYTPFKKGTFKYRADARFIKTVFGTTPSELPLTERFFLGGDTTVRGFRGYAIGPQFEDGAPTGGISSLLLSEEFLYPVYSRVDAFVFVDAGTISMSAYTIGKIYLSYGIGLSVEIMNNMPISFGYGWPVNADNSSQVRRFFVTFGRQF